MRIAYITAGAGNMVCGSCLRDNALAAALLQAGHEVILIPVYTPTRTDEANVSLNRIFLGGINIYLQSRFKSLGRMPAAIARLLDSPLLLRLTSRWGVRVDPTQLGQLTVSMLQGIEGRLRAEIGTLVRYLKQEVSPEIINLPNSLLISLAPAIKAELKVPVCCTLQGEDLFLNGLGEPHHSQCLQWISKHAASVDAFIAVSRFSAQLMSGYLGIDQSRIQIVPLGIDVRGYERHMNFEPEPFTIGYLARIAPEKGLHVLCEAYRSLRQRPGLPPSRLLAAGYLGPEHRSYFQEIEGKMGAWGLSGDFRYHGELDREGKRAFLHGLNILSVPGPYADSKGLFLLEAAAAGVPVVQPRHGAYTEIVEGTGGGVLVDPGHPEALSEAILELWQDPARRKELADRGYEGVRKHFTAVQMAGRALEVYHSLLMR